MEVKNNFSKQSDTQTTSLKNRTDTNSILFSGIKPKKDGKKNTCSLIRKNLFSLAKQDIKDSKELIIKSYTEDLDSAKLNTNQSLNIINSENYNDDILEPNHEEKLDLEHTKNKYADKNYSSSNMSD